MDFDGKISSAASFFKGQTRLDEIDYEVYTSKSPEDNPAERCNKKLGELRKLTESGDFKYKTIVLDSLTTFSDETMKYLMKENPGIKRLITKGAQVPVLQDYQIARIFFKQFITQLLTFPCHVVVTAHVQMEKDEMTGSITNIPMMAGKLAKELPIYFSEVWRSFVKDGKYYAQTKTDSKFVCRTQMGLPQEVELNYEKILNKK